MQYRDKVVFILSLLLVLSFSSLNATLVLDSSFGANGTAQINADTRDHLRPDYIFSSIILPDGKFIAYGVTDIGTASASGDHVSMIMRFNSDGSRDPTFGDNGTVIYSDKNSNGGFITRQPDGKLLLAEPGNSLTLTRYNADGSVDTTFATNGVITTDINPNNWENPVELVFQSDGKILLLATTATQLAIIRYSADGILDTSFDSDGFLNRGIGLEYSPVGIFQLSDNSLLVAGDSSSTIDHLNDDPRDIIFVKFSSTGVFDSTYGSSGTARTSFSDGITGYDQVWEAVQLADNKIAILGCSICEDSNNRTNVLAKFNLDGTLDTSFDTDGIVDISASGGSFGRIVEDDSNNLVLTGNIYESANVVQQMVATRYTANGSLDTSFGTSGVILSPDIAIDKPVVKLSPPEILVDGKYFSAGFYDKRIISGTYASETFDYDPLFVRYNADGTLDTSFDTDGILTAPVLSKTSDVTASMIRLSNGKFVVAGNSRIYAFGGWMQDFSLAQIDSSGGIDSSFNSDGTVNTSFDIRGDILNSVTQQADGKIVVVGGTNIIENVSPNQIDYGGVIARYNVDGTVDTSFDSNGYIIQSIDQSTDIIQQTDLKLVSVGNSGNGEFALIRYNIDGTLDTSFDTDGSVLTSINSGAFPFALLQQSDSKLVAAGLTFGTNQEFALARYNDSDGSLDTSFDTDGMVTTAIGMMHARAYDLLQQSDGKLIAVGYSDKTTTANEHLDVALARYNTDGSLDNTFGTAGITITSLTETTLAKSAVLQADGKIVVAGITTNGGPGYLGGNLNIVLLRYNTDGTLDTSFDFDGIYTLPGNFQDDVFSPSIYATKASLIYDNGDLFVGSNANGDFVVTKLIDVEDPNDEPVLTALADQAMDELDTLTFDAGANLSDPDDLNDGSGAITWSLTGEPAGMTISNVGVISWVTDTTSAETYDVTVEVQDGLENGSVQQTQNLHITVAEVNSVPVINAIGTQGVTEDSLFSYNVLISDQDASFSDTITYSLTDYPAGMSIDQTGHITWTPTSETDTSASVTVQVVDADAITGQTTDTESFSINITLVNETPVFTNTVDSAASTEGQPFSFTFAAEDPEGATLIYSVTSTPDVTGPPPALYIDSSTGELSWTPQNGDPLAVDVTVTVSEVPAVKSGTKATKAANELSHVFTLTVTPVNDQPVLGGLPSQTVPVEDTLSFNAGAYLSDPDDDNNGTGQIIWRLVNAPSGMTISNVGVISWIPLITQGGIYPLAVNVRDGLEDGSVERSQNLQVTVTIVDTDNDLMPDSWEIANNLNPNDPSDASIDQDADGLTNLEEFYAGTNPNNPDTDGDGMPDGWEVDNGFDPTNSSDAADDTDGDGLTNLEEYTATTDPNNSDTDGDGMADGYERDEGFNPLDGDDCPSWLCGGSSKIWMWKLLQPSTP